MMNLAVHNLKKDVRHLRILLILWFGLVILHAAMSGSGVTAGARDMAWQAVFQTLSVLIPILQGIVVVVTLPLLVHDEPLVGTTAFWFTRPISRRTLLLSKSLFVGTLFVLLPLLAEIIVLACNGITTRHILLAVPEILMNQCYFVLLVAVLAVLTPTFARFALVGGSVLVTLLLFSITISLVSMFTDSDFLTSKMENFSLTLSRSVVYSVVTIAFGLTIVALQYLTRKTKRSVCITVVGFMAMTCAEYCWPIDFLAIEEIEVKKEVIDTSKLTATLSKHRVDVSDVFGFRGNEKSKKQIMSRSIEVDGLPEGYLAYPGMTKATLEFSDGKRIKDTSFNATGRMSQSSREWNTDNLEHALGNVSIVNTRRHGHTMYPLTLFEIDLEDYHKYAREKGRLSLEIQFTAYRYEVISTLPMKKKARYDYGSKQVMITDILRQSFGCTVMVRERKVMLLFAEDTRARSMWDRMEGSSAKCILLNKKRRQAFLPADDPDTHFDVFGSVKRLKIKTRTVRFVSDKTDVIDDAWLADAELVLMEMAEVGTFTKTIEVEDFVMKTDSGSPPPEENVIIKPARP